MPGIYPTLWLFAASIVYSLLLSRSNFSRMASSSQVPTVLPSALARSAALRRALGSMRMDRRGFWPVGGRPIRFFT